MKIDLLPFLKWAFGTELAHMATDGESAAWSRMAAYASLGTVIDTFGIGGAGLPEVADVHPDANAASHAVMLLAAERFDLPEGWNPFPELADPHGCVADEVANVRGWRSQRDGATINANLIALVISCAVLGREPEWRVVQPTFRMIERGGKPAWFVREDFTDSLGNASVVEVDGFNARAGRPKRGAYRKYRISGPFAGFVQARIDWYLWSMAMERVYERLSTGLKAHEIRAFRVSREPWKEQVIEKAAG